MRERLARLLAVLTVVMGATVLLMAQAPSEIRVNNGVNRNGTSLNPGVVFVGNPNDGFYWSSTGHTVYSAQGNQCCDFGTGITLAASYSLGWASGSSPAGGSTLDTSMNRTGVGAIGYTAVLQANLPAATNGSIAYCSDCTLNAAFNTVCAGGGSGSIARRLNGSWFC